MSIVTAIAVRRAVTLTLQAHLPRTLEYLSAEEGIELIEPRQWNQLLDFDDLEQRDSPAVVVAVTSIEGSPARRAGGTVEIYWNVVIYAFVRGNSYETTANNVAGTVAAIRATLQTHPGLDDFAEDLEWLGESYDELSSTDARTIAVGSVGFRLLTTSDTKVPPAVPIIATQVNVTWDPTVSTLPS